MRSNTGGAEPTWRPQSEGWSRRLANRSGSIRQKHIMRTSPAVALNRPQLWGGHRLPLVGRNSPTASIGSFAAVAASRNNVFPIRRDLAPVSPTHYLGLFIDSPEFRTSP